jgi:hypothetical protein
LPFLVSPGEEILVSLQFTPDGEEFEQHATIYVEEETGFRPLEITVKGVAQEPHHETVFGTRP